MTDSTVGNANLVGSFLKYRATHTPDQIAYTCLSRIDRTKATSLTWRTVDKRASRIASWLASGVEPQQPVVLLCEAIDEFIPALFGIIYAGSVAVPMYPIGRAKPMRPLARLQSVLRDLRPKLILSDIQGRQSAEPLLSSKDRNCITWYVTTDVDKGSSDFKQILQDPSQVCLIQYTSGSIAEPKGVMLSHANIIANERLLQRAHNYQETSRIVSWVPVAHDWGLINGVLQPAYSGARAILLPTELFVGSPQAWLWTVSEYENVVSGGPAFAYEMCVAKVTESECTGLDLSKWARAGVSAGPVSPTTLERFAARFGQYGFRRDSFYAGYGLAEGTLLVCDSPRGRHPRIVTVARSALERESIARPATHDEAKKRIVGCGVPEDDVAIVIRNLKSGEVCAPGEVGEICVGGSSIAVGYWGKPEGTDGAMEWWWHEGRKYLRTGDVGFLIDGELFVAGRVKDMCIIRGRNIFPQDLESTIQGCHEALRPGCAIAFAVTNEDDDQLVIVQEVRQETTEVDAAIDAIQLALARDHDIIAGAVVLVGPGQIPKTSSGKPQRAKCREEYLNGALTVIRELRSTREHYGRSSEWRHRQQL